MIVDDMKFNPSDYEVAVRLEPEATWTDVAPILDELQEHTEFLQRAAVIRVDRNCIRIAAGGPGMDVWTIGVTLVFGAFLTELVRDVVYPFLKDRLLALYRKVCSAPRAMELKPLGLQLNDSGLSALYRFPPGLSDADFASALGSVVPHFATLRATRTGVVVLDFNASTGMWDVSEQASAFLTSAGRPLGAASTTDLSNGPQTE